MPYQVLINDTVKNYLLEAGAASRRQLRKTFEFLESGLWDGGLRIKKLRGSPGKTVLEGRLNRSDRLVFTLSEGNPGGVRDIHVWGIARHDDVDRTVRAILPENAPFLNFEAFRGAEVKDLDLDALQPDVLTQEHAHLPSQSECGQQRWFVLDEAQWRRLLLYEKGDFEIFLYLTPEQEQLVKRSLPLLVSGTAGSGKSTLLIYYLLRSDLHEKSKLFLTYNRHLRDFSERLYSGLSALTEVKDPRPPLFLTFAQLCRRLVPAAEKDFPPENEVDVFAFEPLFRRCGRAQSYDYALVWEEIRSIVKGAKPQINLDRFQALVSSLRKHDPPEATLRELREELLALGRLSLREPVERILEKQFQLSLEKVALQLDQLARDHPDWLCRALETARNRLRGRDVDLNSPLMSLAEYEQLGRKRAPNFAHNRQELHAIAVWYQEQLRKLGFWDEIDLTRAALQALEKRNSEDGFDVVACDEIQDFTDLQLSLIFRLAREPGRILLAGDPKQIVNPSGFRWEEVRQMFYHRKIEVPELHHLTLNFRCAGSVVLLANALLQLKQRLLGVQSDEKLDQWKYQGRLPTLMAGLSPQEILEQVQLTGADRILLTRTEEERDFLKESLATELVMTIREAKGLEFGTVLLWKFASEAEETWAKIVSQEAQRLHEALIRHEFNLLYVGLTRARHNLLLYDGPAPSIIWNAPELKDFVFQTDDLNYLTQAWQAPSSRQDWKRQGDYYLERDHYRAAAECYRNAEETGLMNRALALAAEKNRDFLGAAEYWAQLGEWARSAGAWERGNDFERAREFWLRAGEKQAATRCHLLSLEGCGKFEELAQYWENQGVAEKAIHYWQRARRPERLAPLLEKQGKRSLAAAAYEEAGDWRRAAALYEKCKMRAEAARCCEKAQLWEEAALGWNKLKRYDDARRCLLQLNDPVRLAEFFEARQEWEKALQFYQQAWNETLEARFNEQLQSGPPAGVRAGCRRALRLALLGRREEAAAGWEKGKQYRLAGSYYLQSNRRLEAARCLEKAGQWMEAVESYLEAPEERERRFVNLRRCLRRAVQAGGARARQELRGRAGKLEAQHSFAAASWIYEAVGDYREASLSAALAGDLRRSTHLAPVFEKYSQAAEKFMRFGRFREGAESFRAQARWRYYRLDGHEIMASYERLLAEWLQGASSEECEEIAQHVRDHAHAFSFPFVLRVLEPLGYCDSILHCRSYDHGVEAHSREGARLIDEARRLESEGQFAGAGLRWLLVQDQGGSERCWRHVPVNERSRFCKEKAGFWKEVLEFLEKEGLYMEAARLAARHGRADLAQQWIIRSGSLEEGARILELHGCFLEAYELYRECGARKKEAQMLEKLKRYEEAAQIWSELGQLERSRKCRQRLARRRQIEGQQRLF